VTVADVADVVPGQEGVGVVNEKPGVVTSWITGSSAELRNGLVEHLAAEHLEAD
jgi:hypothetical protein